MPVKRGPGLAGTGLRWQDPARTPQTVRREAVMLFAQHDISGTALRLSARRPPLFLI